jgi:carbonic anhydrase/acetyltransferase-like protein (isoleucine patch superfamily)
VHVIRPLNGKTPQIHPEAFVSEAAYIVGDVEIGAGSSVWPGCVIRGDSGKIIIGRNTCIQDGTVVHADEPGGEIGDDVVIGHMVMCHAHKVGDGAVLGNGAIVNGGATEIGEYSIVAAGAVVLENAKVPPRTLVVGIPATAKGSVSDEQIKRFKLTADHYAERGRQYKAEGGLE